MTWWGCIVPYFDNNDYGRRETGRITRSNGDIYIYHNDPQYNYIILSDGLQITMPNPRRGAPLITREDLRDDIPIFIDGSAPYTGEVSSGSIFDDIVLEDGTSINDLPWQKKDYTILPTNKKCHFCYKKIDKRYRKTQKGKRICLSCNDVYKVMKQTLDDDKGVILTRIFNKVYGEKRES